MRNVMFTILSQQLPHNKLLLEGKKVSSIVEPDYLSILYIRGFFSLN